MISDRQPAPTGETFRRMTAGEPYIPDEECERIYRRALTLCARYEELYSRNDPARREVLDQLFGAIGPRTEVRPGIRVDYGINISIGADCFFNFNCVMLDPAPITIGDAVLVGSNVQFLTPTHPLNPTDRRAQWEGGLPITVGDNVWIGAGAMLLPGVTIGANSVIGAGSVVTKDVPAHSVAVGNPARVIKTIDPDHRPAHGQYSPAALGLV